MRSSILSCRHPDTDSPCRHVRMSVLASCSGAFALFCNPYHIGTFSNAAKNGAPDLPRCVPSGTRFRKSFPTYKNGYIGKDISVHHQNRYIPTLALSTSGYGSKPISVSSQPAPGQLPFQISVLYAPYSSTNPPACPALFFLTQILHGFLGRMLCILQRCYIIPLKGQRGRR